MQRMYLLNWTRLITDGLQSRHTRFGRARPERAQSLRQRLRHGPGYLQIFNEFNGSNHAELGLKYEKSVVRIYQIIKQVRKKMLSERQGSLFGAL